ncbi:aminopeptidase P family protein [Williamwhitmania taraxaci]|uniref:Xaa-Pro aminopeptidase n=1 Tax=Williamwhitmania taraxaci TaxID=1640674 RepID=A0A1G6H5N6_9BACT|nr:aminopeptidase P family protein [Williamwhitmania taraxaci]SDB89454.1 Xaa-Pro aminopeptidase [Williamwhitmania taraxaci]
MEKTLKLKQLRKEMEKRGISAAIIPSGDPHLSEYVAEHWRTRAWLSGFTGSAGTVVVTETDAGLWTDSRYFLQAERELEGTGIRLFKMGTPGVPTSEDWLLEQLNKKSIVGVDTRLFSYNQLIGLEDKLYEKKITIAHTQGIGSKGWETRPRLPKEPIIIHPEEIAGETMIVKLTTIRAKMEEAKATSYIITALDEIAWLFNLRGSDVAYNPVFYAYAIVFTNRVALFIDSAKVSPTVMRMLNNHAIEIFDYDEIIDFVKDFKKKERILVDPAKTNFALANTIPSSCKIVWQSSPIALAKACKTEIELEGIRNAMINDGVAMVEVLQWIEQTVGKETITEITVEEKLRNCRSRQPYFVGESFGSIVGYAEHGAIVHYSATPETASEIHPKSFLLIDSGGQYQSGTTDITRTIHLAAPTEQEKEDYTLVLKGMIGLARAVFTPNTRGSNLDMLARQPLLAQQRNYGHGTGHGVGFFLNVHEGPQSIRMEENSVTIQPGMVCSDEPGLYRSGMYGIRIENLIACVPAGTTEFGTFNKWETLTLCPIDLKPVNKALLSTEEVEWLNGYHQRVFDTLAPRLVPELKDWLEKKTKAI